MPTVVQEKIITIGEFVKTGNCPDCGAPVWTNKNDIDEGKTPETKYSCDCLKNKNIKEEKKSKKTKARKNKEEEKTLEKILEDFEENEKTKEGIFKDQEDFLKKMEELQKQIEKTKTAPGITPFKPYAPNPWEPYKLPSGGSGDGDWIKNPKITWSDNTSNEIKIDTNVDCKSNIIFEPTKLKISYDDHPKYTSGYVTGFDYSSEDNNATFTVEIPKDEAFDSGFIRGGWPSVSDKK